MTTSRKIIYFLKKKSKKIRKSIMAYITILSLYNNKVGKINNCQFNLIKKEKKG